ncbi:MAG: 1-acyl-sn-glycerol-3-phosphate acyltransferase [Pseudomonadota bacterium]
MPDTAREETERHIVDRLIRERAPGLSSSRVWPVVKPLLYALLNYRAARRLADEIGAMAGGEALDHVSRRLQLRTSAKGLERVPEAGRCLVLANHPTGIADGIAMYDVLRPRRPDVCFFANADARRVCPGFDDVLVPVVWPAEARSMQSSKETLRMASEALENDRALVIFPSGGIARYRKGRLHDLEWEDTAVSLARKFSAPVVPAHMAGPFPWQFHLFDRISNELRDVSLFHELLNKQGKAYAITFGPAIEAERLPDDEAAIERLQAYVERTLGEDPDARFA